MIFENRKWTSSSINDRFLEDEDLNRKHCIRENGDMLRRVRGPEISGVCGQGKTSI